MTSSGGMGISTLAARLTADITEYYDVVIWYSLVKAPELPELLTTLLHLVPQTPMPSLPDGLDDLLNLFFVYLQEQRVLLVLGNLESVLAPEGHGAYRDGYEPYAQLLKRIALREHRGQVLITSRERDDISLVRLLRGHSSNINALTFNPANLGLLASCGCDRTVRVWDTESGDELARLQAYGANGAVQFDPTGRCLAMEGENRSIALWDLSNPSRPIQRLTFESHVNRPLSFAFHPDGSRLVSGSLDRTVRLWDTDTGRMIKIIGRHEGYVTGVAFSPDGDCVVSAGKDDVVHIWHAESGERLHTLRAPGPYEGMNIAGVTGISDAQRASLIALGAVDEG